MGISICFLICAVYWIFNTKADAQKRAFFIAANLFAAAICYAAATHM